MSRWRVAYIKKPLPRYYCAKCAGADKKLRPLGFQRLEVMGQETCDGCGSVLPETSTVTGTIT